MNGLLPLTASLVALASLVARRGGRLASSAAVAVGIGALGLLAGTRRGWELTVRRPAWLADVAHAQWLERGVDWLVAASLLALAGSIGAADPALRPAARRALAASAALAVGAFVALVVGAR